MREFSFEQVMLHDEHIGAQFLTVEKGYSTHRHSFVELIYIKDGEGVQEINGVPYDVKRGDFLFVNYEQTHGVFPKGKMTYFEVMFDLEFISRELINKNNAFDILTLSAFENFGADLDKNAAPIVSFSGEEMYAVEHILKDLVSELSFKNPLYKNGMFYVQDLASQIAVSTLAPKEGERVLDMCAAPGGKTFTMAQLMKNKGEIVACDLYEARVGLIAESAKRLGLDIIKPIVCDASQFNEDLGKFDCILCDVPCSGLGVIRRKPEIKYKPQSDFCSLEELQYSILCNAVKYLKKGGRILYSTCTLRCAENEKLVIRFQKEYNNLNKVSEKTLMPHIDKTDGFYYALFKDTL